MLSPISFLSVLGLASAATATTHNIHVGNLNTDIAGLRFTPNVTTAAVGDRLVFHFYPGHHNVVQGTFSKPCQPLSGGFYSGFITADGGEATEIFTVTVNDTNPIWIYCSEVQHCQLGMAGVINAPESGYNLEAYIAAAAKTSISTTPATVAGGVISSNPDSSSPSPSPPPSSSSPLSTASVSGKSTASAKPTAQTKNGAAGLVDGRSVVLSAMAAVLAVGAGWAGKI